MFVKETKVRRSGREYSYLQLVEGYRDENGKVRHRVVANLGRRDALKESGQLEALAGSFARLDPPMAGTRREVGALLVVAAGVGGRGVVWLVEGRCAGRCWSSRRCWANAMLSGSWTVSLRRAPHARSCRSVRSVRR